MEGLRDEGYPGLSARERQILALAADGLADKAIGLRLGIAHGTVRTYWIRLRRKMEVSTRGEAIAVNLKHASDKVFQKQADTIAAMQRVMESKADFIADGTVYDSFISALLKALPVPAFRCGPSGGDIVEAGPVIGPWLGIESPLSGAPIAHVIGGQQGRGIGNAVIDCQKTGRATKATYTRGEKSWDFHMIPDLDADGTVRAVVGIGIPNP